MITLIAKSQTSYSPNDKYRKIHIKALPTGIQVWYSAGTNSTAQNVDLTANNANRNNYLVKWTCVDVTTGSSVQKTGQTVVPVKEAYDNTYDFRGGFGPLASYRSHNCGKLTDFTMSNISLDMDVVKDLTTIIRTPDWSEGYDSYLVNLNEANIADFSSQYSTAEIINRLVEDNISYIGWGSSTNENASKEFINKVGEGKFVSTADGNKENQIKLIADYIKSHSTRNVLHKNTTVKEQEEKDYNRYVYLLDDDWTLVGDDDTLLDDGGWTVTYSPTSLDFIKEDDTLDIPADKKVIISHGNISRETFDKEGYYQIYRASEYDKTKDQAEVYLQVHTNNEPQPDFETNIDTQNKTCTIASSSKDDFPGFTEEISATKVSTGSKVSLTNLNVTPNTTETEVVYESGTDRTFSNKVKFTYEENAIYLIRQTVTDCDGEVKTIAKQFSVDQSKCQKPFNSFALNKNDLLTRKDTLTITDQSKAVDGSNVIATYYIQDAAGNYYQISDNKLIKKGTSKVVAMRVSAKTETKDIDLSALASGTYTICMTAQATKSGKTASEVTAEVKKYVTIRKGVQISWNLDGGTLGTQTSRDASIEEAGASYTIPAEIPEKEGYEFAGWKTSAATYRAGQTITCPSQDTTYQAVYRKTTDLTIKSIWDYYTKDGHYHDAANSSLYPNAVTYQLQWKKASDTVWSDYTGRVTTYQTPFTIVSEKETTCETTKDQVDKKTGEVTVSGLEMTDASGAKYQYRVVNAEAERKSYTAEVSEAVTASGSDTISIVTQFTPENASFTCAVETQWEIPKALYDADQTTLSTALQYNSWNYEKEGVTYQQKWQNIQQKDAVKSLTNAEDYKTSYTVWKWEMEEAGQEAASTPYRYRAQLDRKQSTFNGKKEIPSYVTVETSDTHFQYGVEQQQAAVLVLSLDPEYFDYDEAENKITLKKDITLDEPLSVYDDIKINLNGHKLLPKEEGQTTIDVKNKEAELTVIDVDGKGDAGTVGGVANASWVDKDGNRHYEDFTEARKHVPDDTKQITLEKDTTLEEDLSIPEDSELIIKPGVRMDIPKDKTLTVPNGSSILNDGQIHNEGTLKNEGSVDGTGSVDNQGTIENDGVLGNEVTSQPGSKLDAKTSWTDGDKTYYGPFDEALKKAPKGSTITVRQDSEFPKDGKVPDDVTINVNEDAKLTVPEDTDVTIPEGTTINNNGTLDVKGNVTVKNGVVQMDKESILDDKNTSVKVKNGAPDVCVDGLDKVYQTTAYQEAVKEDPTDLMQSEVRLTASRSKNPSNLIKQALPENEEVTRYMEFTTDLYLSWSSGDTKVVPLSDTGTLLLVAVPLKNSEKGKTGYQVYRSHIEDGTEVVETLPQLSEAERNAPEKEGFYMDADYAYIYCQKFSTYAIAYDKENAGEVTTEAAVTTAAQATTEAAAVSKDAKKKKTAKKDTVSGNDLAKLKNLPLLLAKGKGGNKKISLSWLKVKKATKYEIYWSYCDGKTNYKLLKRTGNKNAEHKKLSNKRAYKYFVIAYRTVKGKKVYLAKSPTLHVAMKQDKKTNVKKVTANYKTLTLQKKEKTKLTAAFTKENNKKKLLKHVSELRFYSSNKKVAVVDKKGCVTAKKQGSCTLYVMANNGAFAKIKLTVAKDAVTELSSVKQTKKGMLLKDKKTGGMYRVLSTENGKKTVELVKPLDNEVTSFFTEAVISIDGTDYIVSKIADDAFSGCTKLKKVTLGTGVIEIGKRSFKNCKSLTSVRLPIWLFVIGDEAFAGCSKLSALQVQGSNITTYTCGKNAFKGTSSKMKVTCPAGKKSQYQQIFTKQGLAKTSIFKETN